MRIADLILALQRGEDPNAAILANAAPPPPGPDVPVPPPPAPAEPPPPNAAPGIPASLGPTASVPSVPQVPIPQPRSQDAPPPPPPTTAPVGVKTPITNPSPPDDQPRLMRSPPDLSNMYLELIKKSQNAAALDSGMSLIAAGLSKYPENRQHLIQGAFGQGSRGQQLTSQDIMNLQKMNLENQALMIRQAAKGGLMKRYGIDRDSLDYLDASGKLDEVVKHYNTGTLTTVQDQQTGENILYNNATGQVIARIGGPKPEEGEYVDTPEGRRLMSKRTGQPMGPAVGISPTELNRRFTEYNAQLAKEGKPPIGIEEFRTTIEREPRAAANEADVLNLAAINKERPAENPMLMQDFLQTVKHQDPATYDKNILAEINKARPADKQMGMEEFQKTIKKSGVTVNVGPEGQQFPAPPSGQDYVRTPDGKVKIGPDGKPTLYIVKGAEPLTTDIAAKTVQAKEHEEKKAKEQIQKVFASSNVGNAVDTALREYNKPGATGTGAGFARQLPFTERLTGTIDAALNTIKSNAAFTALQEMRNSNPTGGALGAVSDFENRLLSGTIADLRPTQDPEQFKKGLIRVKAAMHVLAYNKYEAGQEAKFESDLTKQIDEFGTQAINVGKKPGGVGTVKKISD